MARPTQANQNTTKITIGYMYFNDALKILNCLLIGNIYSRLT